MRNIDPDPELMFWAPWLVPRCASVLNGPESAQRPVYAYYIMCSPPTSVLTSVQPLTKHTVHLRQSSV